MAEDIFKEWEDSSVDLPDADKYWQKQYEEAQSGANNFLFFTKERTRIRIMAHTRDFRQWSRKVKSFYRGNWSTKYLVAAYEITDPENQTEFTFQVAVVTKGTWGSITQMIREGYQFFEPNGKALTVMRNPGPPVNYTLIPSPNTIPPNPEMWKAAQELDWDKYVAEFDKMQKNKEQEGTGGTAQTNSLADAIVNAGSPATQEEPW